MENKDLQYYLTALSYRKGRVMLIAVLILITSAAVAFGLPPIYRSTATILIEEQDIPPDLVRSTVTSYADQRIQVISQRVMSRANLRGIIEKYGLYEREARVETVEEIIERMREDVNLEILSSDVIDPRSGRPTQATIAFSLSYDSRDPNMAQRVTGELVSLYLTENIKNRTKKAEETSEFLSEEAERLSNKLADLELRMARFKELNAGKLPQLMELNLQLLDRTERDIRELKNQIISLEERKIYLEGQLAQIDPALPIISSTGERVMDPETKLKILEIQYISESSRYAPEHPNVVKLQMEIAALKRQIGNVSTTDERMKELTNLRTEIILLREKYSPEHPDVVRLSKAISALEQELIGQTLDGPAQEQEVVPENPAYINLQAQLQAVEAQLRAQKSQLRQLKDKQAVYEERLMEAPQVEMEFFALSREKQNTQQRYNEIKAKQMEAQVAQELEQESKGERFTLIDPPQLPETPVKPNRVAILFLGLVLSLGGGFGYAAMSENLDTTIRDARTMRMLTGMAPIASIAFIETNADIRKQHTRLIFFLTIIFASFALLLIVVHVYVKPLDVIWFSMSRYLNDIFLW